MNRFTYFMYLLGIGIAIGGVSSILAGKAVEDTRRVVILLIPIVLFFAVWALYEIRVIFLSKFAFFIRYEKIIFWVVFFASVLMTYAFKVAQYDFFVWYYSFVLWNLMAFYDKKWKQQL